MKRNHRPWGRLPLTLISLLAGLTLLFFTVASRAESTRSLGHQSMDFGSAAQALSLLALMRDHPWENRYQITYTTDVDIVLFGCDLGTQTLVRTHNRPDGHGTAEKWRGDVVYRLQQATAGQSLNDTLSGKSPGSYQAF